MEKRNYVVARSIIPAAVIGICFGMAVFLIADYATGGLNTALCAVTGTLCGLLFLSVTTIVKQNSFYRRNAGASGEVPRTASEEKADVQYSSCFLDPFLEGEIDTAKNENQQVSVILADLDHFREISKSYGPAVGNHILGIFAQCILKCIRQTDIISRYKGNEIMIILPGTDTTTATEIAEKIRETVAGTYIPSVDGVVISSIHCTTGVSSYPLLSDSRTALIRTSEIALSMARRSGENCTRVYQKEFAIG